VLKRGSSSADTAAVVWVVVIVGTCAVAVAVAAWVVLMSGARSDDDLERDEREISAGPQPGPNRYY
jgi:hypothetical protein